MPHCLIIWRVSGRGVFRRRVHQTPVGWHDHVDRIRPICEQNDGSKEPTPLEGAEKSDEPEDAANDDEACLHDVASLVGRLPLGEKRAIVKLEARRLLSDVDVDRSSRKRSGECEREVPDKHLSPPVFTTSIPPVGPRASRKQPKMRRCRAVDFAVTHTGLLSIIGELSVGTSPRSGNGDTPDCPRRTSAGCWLE